MSDLLTFVLSDYRCPHCLNSLRLRWVKSQDMPATPWKEGVIATSHQVCPICDGKIKTDWHPAIVDDWLWGKRLAPGLVLWIVAIVMDFHPIMMIAGTVVLLIGFATVIYYMVSERWQRPYYVKFELPAGDPDDTESHTLPSA